MDTKNIPAFPVTRYVNVDGETHDSAIQGMTLRDYFAAKAVEGMRFNNVDQAKKDERTDAFTLAAVCAYEIADAMLKAREP